MKCQDILLLSLFMGSVDYEKFVLAQSTTAVSCFVGSKIFSLNKTLVYEEKVSVEKCASPNVCRLYQYTSDETQIPAKYVEYGACSFVESGCLEAIPNTLPPVLYCSHYDCSEKLCDHFTPSSCEAVEETDIAILPRCSFKKIVKEGVRCFESFGAGIPFYNRHKCRKSLDKTVGCLSHLIMKCLQGGCPSLLGNIPEINSLFENITEYAGKMKSLSSGLKLLELDDTIIKMIYDMVCPIPGSGEPSLIKDALGEIPEFNVSNAVCDEYILYDLAIMGKNIVNEFFSMTRHRQLCMLFNTSRKNIISMWETRCNSTALQDVLYSIIPEDHHYLIPKLFSAIDFGLEFFGEYQFPKCNEEFSNDIPLKCNVGQRVFSADRVSAHNDDVKMKQCEAGEVCGMFRWMRTQANVDSYRERGFCTAYDNVQSKTCSSVTEGKPSGSVSNCIFDYCVENVCNDFTHHEKACGLLPMKDIALLPRCSVKKMAKRGIGCFEPFIAGIPFYDRFQCRNLLDNAIDCMSDLVIDCLKGDCPSLLGDIPIIRSFFGNITEYAGKIKSLSSSLKLMELDENVIEMIYETVCPIPDTGVPIFIKGALEEITRFNVSNPVCDEYILYDLAIMGRNIVYDFFSMTTHGQLCTLFESSRKTFISMWETRCNANSLSDILYSVLPKEYHYLIKEIFSLVDMGMEMAQEYKVPKCNKEFTKKSPLRCNVGLRVFSLDRVSAHKDDVAKALCKPGEVCGMLRWTNTKGNEISYRERGICTAYKQVKSMTCNSVQRKLIGNASNCVFDYCVEDTCSDFTGYRRECGLVPMDDVAILPKCSFKRLVKKGVECLEPFIAHMPYDDQQRCRNSIDRMINCVTDMVVECLQGGDCPSLLDDIPGLRSIFKEVVQVAGTIDSLSSGLKLLELNNNIIEMVYNMMCPVPASGVPSLIQGLLDEIGPMNFSNPVCDDRLLDDLVDVVKNAITTFYTMKTHEQMCTLYNSTKTNLMNMWKTRCNPSTMREMLYGLLPKDFHYFIPDIFSVVNFGVNFFESYQFPNCGDDYCDASLCGGIGRCSMVKGNQEEPSHQCKCPIGFRGNYCNLVPLLAPILLSKTASSISCVIDPLFLYGVYEVRVTSTTGSSSLETKRFFVNIRNLDANTEYTIAVKPLTTKRNKEIQNAAFSPGLSVTTDAPVVQFSVQLPNAVYTDALGDRKSEEFRTLAKQYRKQFLDLAEEKKSRIAFKKLDIRAFRRGSVFASFEGSVDSERADNATETQESLQEVVQGSDDFNDVALIESVPSPPNITITDVSHNWVSGSITEVDDAISYSVEILCDSGFEVENTTNTTFSISGISPSDVCVLTAKAEVQINTTQVAVTDASTPVQFTTGPVVKNLTLEVISITETRVQFPAVPRAMFYYVNEESTGQSYTLAEDEVIDDTVQQVLSGLEPDVTYDVTVTVDAEPTNGISLRSPPAAVQFKTDSDECAGSNFCQEQATCVNTLGSYQCACTGGCVDIDECADSSLNVCDLEKSVCVNSAGSYACQCSSGFEGSGMTCQDVDECTSGENYCDANAFCSNTVGSYQCSCNEGFGGNGIQCSAGNVLMPSSAVTLIVVALFTILSLV